jgi:Uma2 family endonuclease
MDTITINLYPVIHLTDEQFYQLCMANKEINFELDTEGKLIILPPREGNIGIIEADLITDLNIWNRKTKLGKVFSSSTGFRLPNGANRSPDVAWVKSERWEALTEEEKEKFPPITPDFIIELRSRTDRLKPLQEKMQEYIENGLRLGWLINLQDQQVEIYRPSQPGEVVQLPALLSGEDVLPGFELNFP